MSVPKRAFSGGPELCKPSPFPVLRYVQEYASYLDLDALRLTDLHESDRVITISDYQNVLRLTYLAACVKR